MELHLAALDREQGVGAPLVLVGRAAARLAAAAPFVAEQELGAVVVERRRVPERHVGVGGRVDADRMLGIVDVEQQAQARAGAAREPDLGIDGDVVALIRALGGALVAAARPPAPRPAPRSPRAAAAAAAASRSRGSARARSWLIGGTGRPWKMRGELTIAAVPAPSSAP